MAFKRFISVALAGLMVVSSINTGSIRAYASSNESELFTAEDIIEAGEESEGAELMEEVAQTEQDVAVSEEDGGLADEDVVDDDIIGSDESADEAETVEVTLDANGGLFGGEEEILVINVKAGGSLSNLIDAPANECAYFITPSSFEGPYKDWNYDAIDFIMQGDELGTYVNGYALENKFDTYLRVGTGE